MKRKTRHVVLFVVTLACAIVVVMMTVSPDAGPDSAEVPARPALTVAVTQLQSAMQPTRVRAYGNVMAWQEASVGTEADGLRLAEVKVNVGDEVRRGQVLATFAAETVAAELAQRRAATAEAQATLAEAQGNAQRARELQSSGALSKQQVHLHVTAEHTARARLDAARALERLQHLRLAQTQVMAPDDGVISARSATVGAVLPAGQELFRLIRDGRLEWRAEVAAADLGRFTPGQLVRVIAANGEAIEGRVRRVAPTVDMQLRNGLVYVDLPAGTAARAGMFALGEFEVGAERMLTLPQSAVLQHDGFSYVLQIGPEFKVSRVKVTVGRRVGDRVEIIGGIDGTAAVVEAGAGFLAEGDLVRVVQSRSHPSSNPASHPAYSLTRGSAQ
ncbi:efflux RND transporter periplasmic adaptor subunit [Pseudomonas sp. SWRI154]|uniref:efflux RND transporter periplasmic adaptor subunit n=1 Tax=Pseudomonas sp. SWRI154 TaxID=2745501 RepID=UPI0016486B23|nr:efflux RND transporter periplasmic adaptor subunit [Pseudomonas sp. SWRI154]MBC3362426.1 efflux RND transporter periplasmic adaptor subunit [Pseudomonas sp. SWRI154]